jgi:hypothetical protein
MRMHPRNGGNVAKWRGKAFERNEGEKFKRV